MAGVEHIWGTGMESIPTKLHGGLYVASNASNMTAVWNALVDSKLGAVDTFGGIEHLQPDIGRRKKLPVGLLVWLTKSICHMRL
jgi:hypothetical protein